MFDTRPYALIVDSDEARRAQIAAALRESGFVAAAFREGRGALGALAARPVEIAVVAGRREQGEDALALARQLRHCRPETKLLFTGAADNLPATPVEDSRLAVTSPFDRRRLLAAVFELLARDGDDNQHRREAELGLLAARLACLHSRHIDPSRHARALDVAQQIETVMATRAIGAAS